MSVGTRRAASSSPAEVDRDVVGGSEQPIERHRPLEKAVERVVGGEADPGQDLLAVRRDDPGRAPAVAFASAAVRRCRLVAGCIQRCLECFDRHERVGESVPNGLERRDRATELDAFHGVRAGEERASSDRPRRSGARPRAGRARPPSPRRVMSNLRLDGDAALGADDVEAGVRVDALRRPASRSPRRPR